jgi:hypothetical protein
MFALNRILALAKTPFGRWQRRAPRFKQADSRSSGIRARVRLAAAVASLLLAAAPVRAQLNEFGHLVGKRVAAATILGGDFGITGGSYDTGSGEDISLTKFGGGGDIGDPKPLGDLGIGWQWRLQGSMGSLTAKKEFTMGSNAGDRSEFKTLAIEFGGGGRLWLGDHLSLAPTIMGMYGHTDNTYTTNSAFWTTNSFEDFKKAGRVDWDVDTWTIRPALNLQYQFAWHRTIFTFSSDAAWFHTASFRSSNPNVTANSDSETWQNKIDVDIPLWKTVLGHELRTGGFLSRTELYDDLKIGLNASHIYEIHGRVVLDCLNQVWKTQWVGVGGSYLWGSGLSGWSFGADILFKF